jgi:hypothetical protein
MTHIITSNMTKAITNLITNISADIMGLCIPVLQASTISIVAIGGRIPQIVLNIRRGNSGELSITTSALNLAGEVLKCWV